MRKEPLSRLIRTRRSIRQFKAQAVPRRLLREIVDGARLSPSAANLQPLEFVVVDDRDLAARIFPCLKWAATIAPEGNPLPGHEPTAYVVVLVNSDVRDKGYEYDVGAAMMSMILTAWEEGVGSCWLISIDRERIRDILRVPEHYRIDSALALGTPDEEPVLEEVRDSVRYWKDASGRLHVPKKGLDKIIHFNGF